jgi:UDP-3-O-[3-hydroxymyristoyl] glucosamine N-acyltransferase
MQFTAKQIAELIHGVIDGNPEATVSQLSKIEEGSPGTLSFLANPKYKQFLYTTDASIVIVHKDFIPEHPVGATLIRVNDPYSAFAALLDMYNQMQQQQTGISGKASVSSHSSVGTNVYIGDFSFIGDHVTIGNKVKIYPQVFIGDNVTIGNETIIYPGVKVLANCKIGSRCILHPGVVVGSDGFGFAPQEDHHYKKIAQIGNVVIEDDVEVGANTTIDRATLGSTVIGQGVKLDNLIQVAHNVIIGENTVIAAQTGISGSTKIGRNCLIAGQVGIIGHLDIGDDVKIAAQSGLSTNVKEGQTVMGSPAFDVKKYKIAYVHFRNIDRHISRIDALEKNEKRHE